MCGEFCCCFELLGAGWGCGCVGVSVDLVYVVLVSVEVGEGFYVALGLDLVGGEEYLVCVLEHYF